MKFEDGKFYFIKDEFFDLFKDEKIMQNKEELRKSMQQKNKKIQ